ncbi:MotA/TolQ/ExbB proton channel family protein [bacterium]|nr:MotA/TolQ/ExbB proton channel family protein [bacterium]
MAVILVFFLTGTVFGQTDVFSPTNNFFFLFIGGMFAIGSYFIFKSFSGLSSQKKILKDKNLEKGFLLKWRVILEERENNNLETHPEILEDALVSVVAGFDNLIRFCIGTSTLLGLLGTFWGMNQSVSNIAEIVKNTSDGKNIAESFKVFIEQINPSIAGMETAFWTSILGILAALVLGILFVLFQKSREKFYHEALEYANTVLIPEYAPPGIEYAFKNALEEIVADFQATTERLSQSFSVSLLDFNKHFTNSITANFNALQERLAKTLETNFNNFQQRNEALVNRTINSLREQAQQNHQNFAELFKEQKREFKEIIRDFRSVLGNLSTTLAGNLETIKSFTEQERGFVNRLDEGAAKISAACGSLENSAVTFGNSMENISELNQTLEKLIGWATEKVNDWHFQLETVVSNLVLLSQQTTPEGERLQTVFTNLDTSIKGLNLKLETSLGAVQTELQKQTTELRTEFTGLTRELQNQTVEFKKQTAELGSKIPIFSEFTKLEKNLESLEKIQRTVSELKEQLGKLNNLDEIKEHLKAIREKTTSQPKNIEKPEKPLPETNPEEDLTTGKKPAEGSPVEAVVESKPEKKPWWKPWSWKR